MNYILYQLPGEEAAVVYPSGEVPVEQLIPMVVPAGANYKVVEALPASYDQKLYTLNLTPEGDPEPYTIDPLPLPDAKANCRSYEQEIAATETAQIATDSGFTGDVLTASASLPEVSRPVEIQAVFDSQSAVVTELMATLAAIDACTTVDELNNIVNPPTGILFTGRGGGLGPLDLNVSYYTEFNSSTMAESDTELYIPGTATVIAYGSGGPGQFDSAGNCFAPGDYLMQIREVATSRVIAEFEVPLNPAGENVTF